MTAPRPTRTCRDCGAAFAASRTDATVRCPDCRKGARRAARACVVCDGTGRVAYGPSAVDRTVTVVACHRCSA